MFDLAAITLAQRQRLLGSLESLQMFGAIMSDSAKEARRLIHSGKEGDGDELQTVIEKCEQIGREARQIKAELN